MAALREVASSNEAVTVSTPLASSAFAAGFAVSGGVEMQSAFMLHDGRFGLTSGHTADFEELRSLAI